MTKLRRITALLLVIVMAVSLFGITALADHRPGGENGGGAPVETYAITTHPTTQAVDSETYAPRGLKIMYIDVTDPENPIVMTQPAGQTWTLNSLADYKSVGSSTFPAPDGYTYESCYFFWTSHYTGTKYSVSAFKLYNKDITGNVDVKYENDIIFQRADDGLWYSYNQTGVLRVCFTKNADYTVTYDMNTNGLYDSTIEYLGGSAETGTVKGVATGGTLTAPTAPTYLEYTFAGWEFLDYSGNGEPTYRDWDFATDTVTRDVTLYAKWNLTLKVYYRYQSNSATEGELVAANEINASVSTNPHVVAIKPNELMNNGKYDASAYGFSVLLNEATLVQNENSGKNVEFKNGLGETTFHYKHNTPTPPTPDPTYATSYSWTVPEGKTLPAGVNRPNGGSGYADEAAAIASKDTIYKENSVVYDSLGKWTFSGWTNGKTANYNVPFTGVWSFEDATVTEDTASFKVVKVDGSDAALAGATFTLTKTGDPAVTPVAAGAGKNEFTFNSLTEGIYTLTESAPKGYKAVGPWTVTVEKGSVTVTGPTEDTNNVIQKAWNWIVSAVTGNSNTNLISDAGVLTVKNEKQTELPVRFYVEIVKNGGTSLPEYSFTDAFANLPTSSGYAWLNTTNSGKTAADYDAITTSIGTDYETDAGKIKTWLGSADANITIDDILALVDSKVVTADTTINGVKLSDIIADKDKYEVVYSALQKNDDAINSWISGNLQSDGKQHSFHVHVIVKEKAVAPVQTYEYTIHHVELNNKTKVLAPDTTGVAELGATIVVADAKKTIDDYTYDSNSGNITITDGTNEATIYYTENPTPPTPPTTPTTYYYQIVNHYTATIDGIVSVRDVSEGVKSTTLNTVSVPSTATDDGLNPYVYTYQSGAGDKTPLSANKNDPTVFDVYYTYTYNTPPAPPVVNTYYNVTVNWIGYDENGVEAFRDTQGPTSYLAGSAYDLSAEAVKTYDDYSNRGYEMTGASGLRGNVNGDIVLNVYYDAQTNIPTPEPPLVDDPDPTPPTTDIPDDDPALDDTPKTGDSPMSLVFWLLFCMSGCGLVVMAMTAPRKRSER